MKNRRYLTAGQKHRVRERQDHKCIHCGEPLGDEPIEFDHRLPLALGGSNGIDNFEALHARPCHQARTRVTAGMKAKADRQRTYAETGHGRKHERKRWSWFSFSGQKRQSNG